MRDSLQSIDRPAQAKPPQRAETSRPITHICPLFPQIKSKILYALRSGRTLRSIAFEYTRPLVDRAVQEGYRELWGEVIRLRGELLAGAMEATA